MIRTRQDALARWGVSDCHSVDQDALHAGLTGLMTDEANPPEPRDALIQRLQREAWPLQQLLCDALALARSADQAHRRDDRWPHGLVDELEDLIDTLEMHEVREGATFVAITESTAPAVRLAARMSAEHRCIRTRLHVLRTLTADFSAPAGVCTIWRLLYVLLTKAAFDLEARMAIEEARLYAPLLRNRTEG